MKFLKGYQKIRDVTNSKGFVALLKKDDRYYICRYATRGHVVNFVSEYDLVDNALSFQTPISESVGHQILDRIGQGEPFSDAFIFYKAPLLDIAIPVEHSNLEHQYTSTGIKFWRHQEQMWNYRNGDPNTVVSTHISPEGACNLKCSYCSVTYRDTHSRIPLEVIQDYVIKLKSRGLRAVILTGGGEPTAYKQFNELVRWLHNQDLDIGLVTNGTKHLWDRVDDDVCKMFTWVRVSINIYQGWEENIQLPVNRFDHDRTTIGCSMVYTVEHETISTEDKVTLFKRVSALADRNRARYIRMLPNCLLEQDNLLAQHRVLDSVLRTVNDSRFFHQYKTHRTPTSSVCHQSYFRPYLSEEVHSVTGNPGTVYPCDSVVLNNAQQFYSSEYELCHASEILDYLDKKIQPGFNPTKSCQGCVHTDNIDMLESWVNGQVDRFKEFPLPIVHENFV